MDRQFEHVPPEGYSAGEQLRIETEQIVRLALYEDLGQAGDITSQSIFRGSEKSAAQLINREACIISGLDAAREVCRQVHTEIVWLPLVESGQQVPAGTECARLEGPTLSILKAERSLINFVSHLSGVATLTRSYVESLSGLPARVSATRKTMPGMRLLEKQAVAEGGGETHRRGLYDAVLIKDNHIAASGSLTAAVEAVRAALGENVDIEVEADTVHQLEEAIAAGVGRVLLDNMSAALVRECVQIASGRAVIEASGGLSLANVREYAEAGVDILSVGALTMSAPAVDFTLEMQEWVW